MIDDKLREIVSQITTGGHYERLNPQAQQLVDEQSAQIKQAFVDESLHDAAMLQARTYWRTKPMTGQEWYERFEKELDEAWGGYKTLAMNLGISRDFVLKAAKRASGIQQ